VARDTRIGRIHQASPSSLTRGVWGDWGRVTSDVTHTVMVSHLK
jgi:hypothetical protein